MQLEAVERIKKQKWVGGVHTRVGQVNSGLNSFLCNIVSSLKIFSSVDGTESGVL
jgi:hypothetical protein